MEGVFRLSGGKESQGSQITKGPATDKQETKETTGLIVGSRWQRSAYMKYLVEINGISSETAR